MQPAKPQYLRNVRDNTWQYHHRSHLVFMIAKRCRRRNYGPAMIGGTGAGRPVASLQLTQRNIIGFVKSEQQL
jgi:hypothetical protein